MDTAARQARRYNEQEMSRLLRHAAELQRDDAAHAPGLTLAELEEVAHEAAIDVGALHRAAGELDKPLPWLPRLRAAAIAGAPMSARLEHALPLEAPADVLESTIPVLQSASDTPGRASVAGRTLAWRAESMRGAVDLEVLVSVRDGETRIRIEERYGRMAAAIFGAGMGGIGSGVGFGVGVGVGVAIGSALMAVGFPIALLGGSYLGCRALFGGIVRRRAVTLERLLDTLSEELRAATAESADAHSAASPNLAHESRT